MPLTDNQILNYAIENGIIDLAMVSQCAEEKMKENYLKQHKGEIWEGANGFWYTYVPKEDGKRKLLKRKSESDLQDAIVAHYRHEADTFGQMVYQWLDFKISHHEISKQSYDRYEATYRKYFKPMANKTFCEITPRELETFIRDTIADFNLTAKGWSDVRTIILGVFSFGKYDALFSISQFMGDLRLSPKTFKPRYKADKDDVFTQEELKLIEKDIRENPDTVGFAILLAIRTGMRSGEIVGLKWCDIDREKGIIHVCRTEIRYKEKYKQKNETKYRWVHEVRPFTKGAIGSRELVLTKADMEFIHELKLRNPFGEYVFEKNGERIHTRCLDPKLYRICKRIGIKQRSMHKLRKAYATSLINANVAPSIIKEQMGHTDMQTTIDYYYRENHSIEEVKTSLEIARRGIV